MVQSMFFLKISGLIAANLFFFGTLMAEPLSLSVNAESAILMNADTGQILYEKNIHAVQYPASITKIATALYALKVKESDLDKIISAEAESIASISDEAMRRSNYTLPSYWIIHNSSHIGIKKGEELSLKDLLYGMMVPSANDAANVIAQYVSGTIPAFMTELNAFIQSLGCQNTCFTNPHGLHHPKHQTTAYDMAIIAQEALKNPTFRDIVKTVRYTRPKTNLQSSTVLIQQNRLLREGPNYYAKAIGVKTGYTSIAQSTFVAAATHDNRTLIAVLLKTKERNDMFVDAAKMFEAAFNQPKVQRILFRTGQQTFAYEISGADKPVKTYIKDNLTIDYYPAEEPKLKCLLFWKKLTLPIAKDQEVGELTLQNPQGEIIKKISLYASEEVQPNWSQKIKSLFYLI